MNESERKDLLNEFPEFLKDCELWLSANRDYFFEAIDAILGNEGNVKLIC